MIYRYTIFYVDDVPTALSFYESAFGLTRAFLHEGQDYGVLATGETMLSFGSYQLQRQLGRAPTRPDPAHPVFGISFETGDVAAAYDRAVKAGAAVLHPPKTMDWGQTTAHVADPFGYEIELCTAVQFPNPE
jgi:uncharacterized glyoxalase superfamily protein PhnB